MGDRYIRGSTSGGEADDFESRIAKEKQEELDLQGRLAKRSYPDASAADRSRRINLTMEMMQGPAIDGKFFEMLRADQTVQQGVLEIWEFNNRTGMPHPIHLHATQFNVLDRSRPPWPRTSVAGK